jgi:hypothetical protein
MSYWKDQSYLESNEYKYILWIDRLYQKVVNVPGHIVEVGVAYGRNTILFGHQITMRGETSTRYYYGFDTFDGYTVQDLKTNSHLSAKSWKNISLSDINDRIRKSGVNSKYHFIKGDSKIEVSKFIKSKPEFKCALLYVDCNAYEPSYQAMCDLLPHMSPNGIIAIDEKQQGGETKALSEFTQKHRLPFIKDEGPFSVPAYTKINSFF